MRPVIHLTFLAPLVLASASLAQPKRVDLHGDPLPRDAVARLGTVRYLPPDRSAFMERFYYRPIYALSPDGKTIAALTYGMKDNKHIFFLDTSDGKVLRRVNVVDLDAEKMEFSADGKSLICSRWNTVRWLDVETGAVSSTLEVKGEHQGPIAISRDGKLLASQQRKTAYDAPVTLWHTNSGKEVATLPGRGASCRGLRFSADGKRLLLHSSVPLKVEGMSVTIGGGSRVVVSCIDIHKRKIIGEVVLGDAQEVALASDGETIAFVTPELKTIQVRHLPSGTNRCELPISKSRFTFALDGKSLLTLNVSGATLWDANKGEKIRDLEGKLADENARILGLADDGNTVAALDGGWQSDATIVVWDGATGRRKVRPAGHEATVTRIVYSPDGTYLASGSLDKTVRLWNPKSSEHLTILATHRDAVRAIAFSHDGKRLASASKEGDIKVVSVPDGKLLAEFTAGKAEKGFSRLDTAVSALAFSLDEKTLFAGATDIIGWDIATEKEVTRIKLGSDGAVKAFTDNGVALAAHGEILLEGGNVTLQLWDPFKVNPLASMPIQPDERGSVRCETAAFAPGGRMFASSQVSEYQGIRPSYDNAMLRIWERASGQQIHMLSKTITGALAFSPNGRLLASGAAGTSGHLQVGYGQGMDVWDIVTGKKVAHFPHTPNCIAFSPDGHHIATGGRDHGILIWDTPKIELPADTDPPLFRQRDEWWDELGATAGDAYKAMGQMIETPANALNFLKERIKPVERSDPKLVGELIKHLDSEKYPERVKAQSALEKMGEGPKHLIKKAMEGEVRLELRRRLEAVLAKCDATSPLILRQMRTVSLLEWIDTPASRELLQSFAGGAPDARLTLEAQAALRRLKR